MRAFGEEGDPMALAIFEQQAKAVGRLFTIAANFTDPDAYFVGGGVVEAAPHFREWFLAKVREHTALKEEQARASRLEVVPDLDMAGARGAAIAALETVHAPSARVPRAASRARPWPAPQSQGGQPLSKTIRHWPSFSRRQTELNVPTRLPAGSKTGPLLKASSPESSTSTLSGAHENGAALPS